MDEVEIVSVERGGSGWTVQVEIGEFSDSSYHFNVSVDDDYYEKLTMGRVDVETLVQESFTFLLDREPVASILPNFDLNVIGSYFDDFEEEIINRLEKA